MCPTALLQRLLAELHHSPPPLLYGPNFPQAASGCQRWALGLVPGGMPPCDFHILKFGFLRLVAPPGLCLSGAGPWGGWGSRLLRAAEEAEASLSPPATAVKARAQPRRGWGGGIGRRPPPTRGLGAPTLPEGHILRRGWGRAENLGARRRSSGALAYRPEFTCQETASARAHPSADTGEGPKPGRPADCGGKVGSSLRSEPRARGQQ